MWSFRRGNTFSATAFSSYGAFWFSLATFIVLVFLGKVPSENVTADLGWFLLGFAVFNTYLLFWSLRVNTAVFGVFLTLEITEILLFIGFFSGSGAGEGLVLVGGLVGVLTAAVAWYTATASLINSMSPRPLLPTGTPSKRASTGARESR